VKKNYDFEYKKQVDLKLIINLDTVLEKKGMKSNELAAAIKITTANLSILKTGKAKAVRFSTLEAICKVLECQPGDILQYIDEE
jgi:putative transcriptional regulator